MAPPAAGQTSKRRGAWPSLQRNQFVLALMFGNTLQALGIQLFIPILPIYLSHRGASTSLIGLVIAMGIAGYGLSQFPAGLVADRFDRKAVALVGLALYGALYLVYLLPIPVSWLLVIRFCHAASGGIYTPSAAALLADLTPLAERGRVFGLWQSTGRAGLLVGPLVGGVLAGVGLPFVFISACALVLLSAVPLLWIPRIQRSSVIVRSSLQPGLVRGLLPSIAAGSGGDWVQGTVSAIWSVYMLASGAATWEIGLSFTLFALPAVTIGPWLGDLADRKGARAVLVGALISTAAVAPLVTVDRDPRILIALAATLGITTAASRPVIFGEASRIYDGARQARAQGVLQTGLLTVQSAAALTSGLLYSRFATLPFDAVTLVCIACLVSAPWLRATPYHQVAAEPSGRSYQ
jgi:MFS transporter, DHA1 family, tetracycline resistance protein